MPDETKSVDAVENAESSEAQEASPPQPSKPVRIGVCGAGYMAQRAYMPYLKILPSMEFVALAEMREPLRDMVADRYNVSSRYADARDMLEKEDLDGVIVCVPFKQHGALIPELLQAGKPILMEMPLANSIEAGEAIVEAEKKSGTFVMVGYQRRSDPAVRRAREFVEEHNGDKIVGKLRYVRNCVPYGAWMSDSYIDYIEPPEGVMPEFETSPMPADMDMDTYQSYLTMLIYYSHQVNLIRHLTGESITPVFADEKTLVVFRTDSGISCTLEMSPYSSISDWEESMLLAFDHGYIDIDIPPAMQSHAGGVCRIFQQGENQQEPQVVTHKAAMYSAGFQQVMNFAGAIQGSTQPPCTAADALEDLKTVREIIRLRGEK